jgi:hypothetical protein
MESERHPYFKICEIRVGGPWVTARTDRVVPSAVQVEAVVRKNLHRIHGLSPADVARISIPDFGQQNAHSSRPGAEIRLHLATRDAATVPVWAKWVEAPAAAFGKMRDTYERAAARGVAAPIPEPYFHDPECRLVFMAAVAGNPLRRLVLRHCLGLGPGKNAGAIDIPGTLHRLGQWLCRYQEAVRSDQPFDLDRLAGQVLAEVARDDTLSAEERRRVARRLRAARDRRHAPPARFELSPHNDFTLRNILVDADGAFHVIDWDAMAHPEFSDATSGWWDASLFLLNLQSFARFRPFTRGARLAELSAAFLSGYIDASGSEGESVSPESAASLLYLFALRYWYSIGTDRRLADVYHDRFGWRYVNTLRHHLFVAETADVVGTPFRH